MSRSRQSGAARPSRERAAASRSAASAGARGEDASPVVASGDERLAVSAVAADFESGQRLGRHRHRRAQLVYASEGVMTVETGQGIWVVPPLRALWIPPGVTHSIRMSGTVRMRTVYFEASSLAGAATPERCAVLAVSPLLRELLVRIAEGDTKAAPPGPRPSGEQERQRDDQERRERQVRVLVDELVSTPADPLEVPMPSDARLRHICQKLLDDPSDARDSAAWAKEAGTSERTLARLFPAETGMTLVRWRQQARLLHALERLAAGDAVTTVALDLGYASTSAFVKLFRESFGTTPARYFAP
jgi:AraC-like DNA-binding protein/quercetin dioxygenase-like cupin family protein